MKLSVMMITYNHERYIAQAIDSILAQRVNFDYEIVIGEDCSTDDTRAVIMDFCRRYPGRILLLTRDRNIGAARNAEATLAACRGQYLAMLEGDDYWTSENKLQKQVEFLDINRECSLCCHRVKFLAERGSADTDVFPSLPSGTYTIEHLLKGNFIMTCSTVLRRDFVPALPPWLREMKVGDWAMFALAARHGTIELMDENMAVYRIHPGGTWSSLPSITRLREGSRMLRALNKHLDYQYADTIRETIAAPYLEMATTARQNGNRADTAKHLFSCLRNGGWLLPDSSRIFASLAAYVLTGSWYKVFSRAQPKSDG